jgi:sugar O-acyltransferase (sialic acid O-acetyltransferase NeuD family)
VIIGAGGQAREALDVFEAVNARAPVWQVLGFLVEPGHHGPDETPGGRPILGDLAWLSGRGDVEALCAVGPPELRRRLVARAAEHGARFCSLVHPGAAVSEAAAIGAGTLVSAGCVVTHQARLGDHVHLNVQSSVSHDAVLEDYATLAPGVHVCGHARVGEGAWLGVGADVVDRVRVGAWSVVGAGTVVLEDVPPNTTVVGQPGRIVSTREDGWHRG